MRMKKGRVKMKETERGGRGGERERRRERELKRANRGT